jgi:hypothetical protein
VHLTGVADNAVYVPGWTPLGGEFWVIVIGICFTLAGLAILSGILDVLAAWQLALMFLAFNAVALPRFIFPDPRTMLPGAAAPTTWLRWVPPGSWPTQSPATIRNEKKASRTLPHRRTLTMLL